MNPETVKAANECAKAWDKTAQDINRLVAIYTGVPSDYRRVLVCDDDKNLRELLAHTLEQNGFLVTQAADGAEVLTALERNHLGCIILDLGMPNVNGHEVLKQIKHVPVSVYVFTGQVMSDEEKAGLKSIYGVREVFTKPFSLAKIVALLKQDRAKEEPCAKS